MNKNNLKHKIGVSWKISAYEEIEKMGYDFMDVFGTDLMSIPEDYFEMIAKKVIRGTMPCENICIYCTPSLQMMGNLYVPEAISDYAQRICKRCATLGISGIGIGAPYSRTIPEGYSKNKAEEQLINFFRLTAKEAEKYGICIMVEPLNKLVCNHMLSTKDTADFIDKISMKNVRMVFDFHHFIIMKERLEDLKQFVPYMRSVQFNEVDLYTGDKKFLIEENAAYYKKLLGTLIEYGYTGPFSIEAISTDNFYADAKRSLSISKRILAEIT